MRLSCLVILILVSLASAGQSKKAYHTMLKSMYKGTVPLISIEDTKIKLENPHNITLLDTRELKEYEVSHLKNAIFTGYDNFSIDSVPEIPKNDTIIVYCSVGYRSERVGEILLKDGNTNVFNLYGGIFHWINSGNEVTDTQNTTTRIHAYDRTWGRWLTKGEKVYE